MTTSTTLFCFLLFTRSVFSRRTLAIYRAKAAPPLPDPDAPRELPKSATLGGVPLHILLSERANPGALLRETLLHRPGARDD
jgi:hypothetical protein